jgi:enterobactin synthetase component D
MTTPDREGVRTIESPLALPAWVSCSSVSLTTHAVVEAFEDVTLPPELSDAVHKRRLEFLAGRHCARCALEHLTGVRPVVPVARAASREPVWPPGVVGSITHTAGFASAAVAWTRHASAIGIDTEQIVSNERGDRVAPEVLLPAERRLLGTYLDSGPATTVAFSAKESLYKCLYPIIRRYFHYPDAALARVDLAAGTFEIRLRTDLSPTFGAGASFPGVLTIDSEYVHTAIWLPPSDNPK